MGFFIGGGTNVGVIGSIKIDNFSKTYAIAEWVLVNDMYELEVVHNQGTKKIIVDVYENGIDANINGIKLLNENKLKLINDTAIDCMVVINSGIGGISTGGINIATFEIEEDGNLYCLVADNNLGNINYKINENGELEVEING